MGVAACTSSEAGRRARDRPRLGNVSTRYLGWTRGVGGDFFGSHSGTVLLDDPDMVVQGTRVLHLHYTVNGR
jgi:hypothetical protein